MRLAAAGLSAAAVVVGAVLYPLMQQRGADHGLTVRLNSIAPTPDLASPRTCQQPEAAAPIVLLILGQSNAGNHGAEDEPLGVGVAPQVTVFSGGLCLRSGDPLPGGTGRHKSVWSRLPAHLKLQGYTGEVVIVLLAVEATTVNDWSRVSSPLHKRLQSLLLAMQTDHLRPSLVLWQQGEADALRNTKVDDYVTDFESLLQSIRAAGVTAPVLLARSTYCNGSDGRLVRQAVSRLLARLPDVQAGPDTDTLLGKNRTRGCHFSSAGVDAAAALWAGVIAAAVTESRR